MRASSLRLPKTGARVSDPGCAAELTAVQEKTLTSRRRAVGYVRIGCVADERESGTASCCRSVFVCSSRYPSNFLSIFLRQPCY